MNDFSAQKTYDPNPLLDAMIKQLGLKNDAALSRVLGVGPPVISKIRHRTLAIGACLLLRMHEESNLSIKKLRAIMGDQRAQFRIGTVGIREMITANSHKKAVAHERQAENAEGKGATRLVSHK